jgi:hypothetical protein
VEAGAEVPTCFIVVLAVATNGVVTAGVVPAGKGVVTVVVVEQPLLKCVQHQVCLSSDQFCSQ